MVAFEMTVPYDQGQLVRRVREQVRPLRQYTAITPP